MENVSVIEEFKKLGYTIQEPTKTDKTYYFVKQELNNTKQIFITYGTKTAKIEVIKNYKTATNLTNKEEYLIQSLIVEVLGLNEYSYGGE